MKTKITIFALLLVITQYSFAKTSLSSLEKAISTSFEKMPSVLKGFHYEHTEKNGSVVWANNGINKSAETVKTNVNGDKSIIQYVFTNSSYYEKILSQVKSSTNNNLVSQKTTPSKNGMSEKSVFYENSIYRYGFRILSQNGKVYGYNLYIIKL